LPTDIAALSLRQVVEFRATRTDADLSHLAESIKVLLSDASPDARTTVTEVSGQLARATQSPPTSTHTADRAQHGGATKIVWRVATAVVLVVAAVVGVAMLRGPVS
jgi:anti-sigma-K factor RskA